MASRYDDRPRPRRRNTRDDYDDRPRRRREPEPAADDQGDDGNIIVLSGRRGNEFLDRLFGGGASDEPYDDDQDQDDDDQDDDDDDLDDRQDPPARNGHRFFGGR